MQRAETLLTWAGYLAVALVLLAFVGLGVEACYHAVAG
jgi:hypothetical protein